MGDHQAILDELYQAYLKDVYQEVPSTLYYPKETHQYWKQQVVSPTYGEMLYPSVKKLLRKIALSSEDIFLDLGSGLGKLALQVFMQSEIKKVIGIEALPELGEQAQKVAHRLHSEFPFFWEGERQLELMIGNFLTQDWEKADIVYTCSTCFRTELLDSIGERINQEEQVKQVFTLRPLSTLKRLTLREVFTVECSWDTTLCYHYAQ